jgi:eukaryotic-like serine/threonine-protein kinase
MRLPMRTVFRALWVGAVLLIVALVAALTTMRFAVHGREVATPNLIGMTLPEAERAASAAGLGFEVERRFYSANVGEGKVMSQVPASATLVRRGWRIRAAESLGPQRVAIPDVVGQSTRAADINIRRRGLELGGPVIARLPDLPSDVVVAQSPPPNASGVSAPRISVLASAPAQPPAFVMPNFVGQPLAVVTEELQEAGLHIGNVNVRESAPAASPPGSPGAAPAQLPPASSQPPPPSEAAGTRATMIAAQDPSPGQKVLAGSAVNFEVVK